MWRGSVGRVAARGKPWPDRRCSSVSRVAPSGTPWADRPASTVSRVAPPWHAQAALTCLFVELVGDSRTLGRPPRQQCKQSSAPVGRPGGTYLSLCGTCRVLVGNLYVFLWELVVLVHGYKNPCKVRLFLTSTHEVPQKDTQVPYKYPTSPHKFPQKDK